MGHGSTMLGVTLMLVTLATSAFFWLRPGKTAARDKEPHQDWKSLLLVDGDCALCNGFVQFVIYFNAAKTVRFGTQQSEFGQKMLKQYEQPMDLSTMVMMEREPDTGKVNCYTKSTGVLRTMKFLDAPANVLGLALAIPIWIRDPCYTTVAKWRYTLFGNTKVELSKERSTLDNTPKTGG